MTHLKSSLWTGGIPVNELFRCLIKKSVYIALIYYYPDFLAVYFYLIVITLK